MKFRGSAVDLKIKVGKTALVDIVTANLGKHKDWHEKAVKGYKLKLIEQAEENMARAKEGQHPNPFPHYGRPKSYVDQYERALGMLKLAEDGPITLSAPDYARFVEDDWDWKAEFTQASNFYAPDLADDFTADT